MCDKKLTDIPNQKYKISLALTKVFDITERKVFMQYLFYYYDCLLYLFF